jgi:hypothetical protein
MANRRLYDACKNGDMDEIKKAITQGATVLRHLNIYN